MSGLSIALLVEAALFGFGLWFKLEVDPDMNQDKWRKKFMRSFYLEVLVVFAATLLIWWYWHPLQHLLQDLPKFIQRRP